ncbi:MAG: esterase/lipase family protein [Chlamydiales bacterium]
MSSVMVHFKKLLFLFVVVVLHCSALRADECDKGVVVTIHGFLQTARSLRDMSYSLRYVGLKVYNYEYPSVTGSIRDHGHCLATYIKWVSDENPGKKINFVCFSLGSVILRSALNDPCCPAEAKAGHAVFIAPPSSGSTFGRSFSNFSKLYCCLGLELFYELSTYTVCDMIDLGPYPEDMRILIIAGCRGSQFNKCVANDGIVDVSETGIDHPFYFETFYTTHFRIFTYPPVLNLTRYFVLGAYD